MSVPIINPMSRPEVREAWRKYRTTLAVLEDFMGRPEATLPQTSDAFRLFFSVFALYQQSLDGARAKLDAALYAQDATPTVVERNEVDVQGWPAWWSDNALAAAPGLLSDPSAGNTEER